MKRLGARAIVRASKATQDTALQAAATQWSQAATAVLVQLTERVDALTARVEALEAARKRSRMRRRRALAPRPLVGAALARRAEESDGWTFAPCLRADRPCTTRRGGSCTHAPSGKVCACLCHVPLELHDRYTRKTPC